MRNCKSELLTALVASLKVALPTMPVSTKKNWFDDDSNTAYPYIYIGEVYQTEDGPKLYYIYNVELLIHIVYKDITDLGEMYTSQNAVLGLFDHPQSLMLLNDFDVMNTEMLSNNDIEVQVDSGILNVGLIRVRYTIEDMYLRTMKSGSIDLSVTRYITGVVPARGTFSIELLSNDLSANTTFYVQSSVSGDNWDNAQLTYLTNDLITGIDITGVLINGETMVKNYSSDAGTYIRILFDGATTGIITYTHNLM